MLMMAETCTEWDESRRLVGEVLDRDEKLIKRLERERNRLGTDLLDARRKLIAASLDIEARKSSGRDIKHVEDAPAFYMANIKKINEMIVGIDNQIIIAREELHDIADLIGV